MQSMTRARPLGITIISIILAVEGILGVISGIVLLTAGGAIGTLVSLP